MRLNGSTHGEGIMIKVGDVLKSYEELEMEHESGEIVQIPVLTDLVVVAVHDSEDGVTNIDVTLDDTEVTVANQWDRSGQSDYYLTISETLNLDWEPETAAKRYAEIEAERAAREERLAKIREEYRASRAKLYS
ncbi:hypothetical protein SEA_ATUIN_35 [Arthrobacter phage Atuin]|nr:hypothetical protein SEA_ATUIN_134 [Arthrobacter phage Atuin]